MAVSGYILTENGGFSRQKCEIFAYKNSKKLNKIFINFILKFRDGKLFLAMGRDIPNNKNLLS